MLLLLQPTAPPLVVRFTSLPLPHWRCCCLTDTGWCGVLSAQLTVEENPPDGPFTLTTLQLLAWSTALAFFGVFFAVRARQETIPSVMNAGAHPAQREVPPSASRSCSLRPVCKHVDAAGASAGTGRGPGEAPIPVRDGNRKGDGGWTPS